MFFRVSRQHHTTNTMDNDILPREDDILLDLVIMDIINNGIPRQIYVRHNHFNSMPDLFFFQHFRLRKETVLQFLPQIEERLEYIHNLNNSVSPINQLLICLRYYATGCHQLSLAFFGGMHKSTVNRIINRVTVAVCHLANQYIKIPETDAERRQIQLKFFEIAAFPKVLAVVDGSHIKIQSPGGDDAEVFRNRKHYFSVNIQGAVGPTYKFLNLVARWPGSTHDMTIFNNCMLKAQMELNNYPNCFLLGDSGYGVKKYLMTPLLEPQNRAERRYNESLIRTRVIVENTFGIWKRRFPIMAYGCRTKLQTTMNIVVATAVLHNLARDASEDLPPDDIQHNDILQQINDGEINNNLNEVFDVNNEGFQTRRALINNYFA